MAFKQLNLTFNGSVQVLTGALGADVGDVPVKQIGLQADTGNSNIFLVGDSLLSGSLYSSLIPSPVSSVPYGHSIIDIPKDAVVRLSEIYVKGTNAEKMHGWIIY